MENMGSREKSDLWEFGIVDMHDRNLWSETGDKKAPNYVEMVCRGLGREAARSVMAKDLGPGEEEILMLAPSCSIEVDQINFEEGCGSRMNGRDC
jgi:hypothetical protein